MKDNEMIRCARFLRRLVLGSLCAFAALGESGIVGSVHAQTAQAQEPAPAPAPAQFARSEVGHATAAWLELQRGNTQAAPIQPMLGEEAGLAYRRYMESFKSKIPDLYGSALNQGSSGQGGGAPGQMPPQN